MRQTWAGFALVVVMVTQHRLEQAEMRDDRKKHHAKHSDDRNLDRPREAADNAARNRKARRTRPQHGYRTLLAKTRAHQTMMDMAEIGMVDSLMITQSANDGRHGVHNGNAGDDKRHEHDHNTLRTHNARHRDDAHHKPQKVAAGIPP